MRRSRIVVFVAALLLLVAGAPGTAGLAVPAGAETIGPVASSPARDTSNRDVASQLAAVPTVHRAVVGTAAPRRHSDGGTKLRLLCPCQWRLAVGAGATRIDEEADARLLRASNTPCCVRGPPASA